MALVLLTLTVGDQSSRQTFIPLSIPTTRRPTSSTFLPLAWHCYSPDNGRNLIEYSSAIAQEIKRRRLEHGLSTPPISRQVSVGSPRRARPSFIPLAPSRDTLIPPSPILKSRHSSPNIVIHPSLSQSSSSLPPGTDWMTAPSPAFSFPATHASGALLRVEQDSVGKRARHKSLPSISKSAPQNSSQNKSESVRSRSLKRFRSVGRLFKHDRDETDVPPVPSAPLDPGAEGPVTPPKDAKPETSISEENKDRGRVRKLWDKVLDSAKRQRA